MSRLLLKSPRAFALRSGQKIQFAVLSAALFQALAIAGFVADTRAQIQVPEGRYIASSTSTEKLAKGTPVLLVRHADVLSGSLLRLGAEDRGQILEAMDDGRYLIRHVETVEGQRVGHSRIMDRDDFLLTVGSVDGLRLGETVELAAGRKGRITGFYQTGLIEVDRSEFVRRHDLRVPASHVSF